MPFIHDDLLTNGLADLAGDTGLPLVDQNPYLTQALLEDEEILLILGYYYNDKM